MYKIPQGSKQNNWPFVNKVYITYIYIYTFIYIYLYIYKVYAHTHTPLTYPWEILGLEEQRLFVPLVTSILGKN